MADDVSCDVALDPEFGNIADRPAAGRSRRCATTAGRPTRTQLLAGSPAIGEAEPGPASSQFDQRGLARPPGADGCDIGAYERAAALTVTTHGRPGDSFCTESGLQPARGGRPRRRARARSTCLPGNYVLSLGALSRRAARSSVRGVGARVVTLTAVRARACCASSTRLRHAHRRRASRAATSRRSSEPFGAVGGGIAVEDAALSLIDSAVDDNVAGRGGGIFSVSGGVLLTDTTVAANHATDSEVGDGGGLFLRRVAPARSTNSTISGNTAERRGGGIATLGTELQLANVTLAENSIVLGQGPARSVARPRPAATTSIGETAGAQPADRRQPRHGCARQRARSSRDERDHRRRARARGSSSATR